MSIVPAELEVTDVRSDVAPASARTAVHATPGLVADPRPSLEHPYEIGLSAELVDVISRWMREPRWKRWIEPAPLPGYRRHLD